jgi:branched-chain amino acid aminotransferase
VTNSLSHHNLNAVVNVNGDLKKPSEALGAYLPVFDRSYLYGDSLYEVARTYQGKFLHLEEHLIRLFKSASLCRMKLAQPISIYKAECEKTLASFLAVPGNQKLEAYCRLIVSRGISKIGFGEENLLTPSQFVVIVQPLTPPTAAQFEKGYRYQISQQRIRNHPKATDPAMKSGNYLNSLLAYLESTQDGFDDSLLCDGQGFVTEGTTFNIFYVRRGIIATAPLDIGILDGITRRHVIDLARKMEIEVREVRYPKERLYEADEVFMTSTIKEVFPVTQLDKKRIASGKPGPMTRKLAQAFRSDVKNILKLKD